MQIGIWLPSYCYPNLTYERAHGAVLDYARRCNDFGYDIWTIDHLLHAPGLYGMSWLEPLHVLTAAGAVAPDVQLGTGILVLPLRNPVVLAKEVATMDLLTGSRYKFGVGPGWYPGEFAATGTTVKERGARTDEILDAVTLRQLGYHAKPILLVDLGGYWRACQGLFDQFVAAGFAERRRHELLELLRPLRAPLEGHPWEHGFLLGGSPTGRLPGAAGRWTPGEMEQDWTPVAPQLVCEVAYDQLDDHRFRHPARFRRWRPDRDPLTCRLEQLDAPGADVGALLA